VSDECNKLLVDLVQQMFSVLICLNIDGASNDRNQLLESLQEIDLMVRIERMVHSSGFLFF